MMDSSLDRKIRWLQVAGLNCAWDAESNEYNHGPVCAGGDGDPSGHGPSRVEMAHDWCNRGLAEAVWRAALGDPMTNNSRLPEAGATMLHGSNGYEGSLSVCSLAWRRSRR